MCTDWGTTQVPRVAHESSDGQLPKKAEKREQATVPQKEQPLFYARLSLKLEVHLLGIGAFMQAALS